MSILILAIASSKTLEDMWDLSFVSSGKKDERSYVRVRRVSGGHEEDKDAKHILKGMKQAMGDMTPLSRFII
jgi:hypothetical protein